MKEKVRIIYVSYYREPDELQGAMKIATNTKVPITIVGVNDVCVERDVGGMYVVSGSDLKGFINAVKTLEKR